MIATRLKHNAERRFAKRVCTETLAALQAIRSAQPELKGNELYLAVIARRSSLDAVRAQAILRHTEASLEDWGSDREPKFLDVVRYMIVSEYLGADATVDGMSIDLGAFLSKHIDPQL